MRPGVLLVTISALTLTAACDDVSVAKEPKPLSQEAFAAVCDGNGAKGTTAYKLNPAFDPNEVHPVRIMQSAMDSDEWEVEGGTSNGLQVASGSADHMDYANKPGAMQLVACAKRVKFDSSPITCTGYTTGLNQDERAPDVKMFPATYDVRVREALTGKQIGQFTHEAWSSQDCPSQARAGEKYYAQDNMGLRSKLDAYASPDVYGGAPAS